MLSLGYVSLCWYRKTHTPSCTHAWHAWRWRDNDRAKAGAHENGCFAYFFETRSAFMRWATRSSLWKSSEKTWIFSDIINLRRHVTNPRMLCLPLLWMPVALFLRLFCSKLDSWNIGVRQSIRQVVCPPSALLISGGVWKYKSLLQKRAALVQVTQNCTALFVKFKDRIS